MGMFAGWVLRQLCFRTWRWTQTRLPSLSLFFFLPWDTHLCWFNSCLFDLQRIRPCTGWAVIQTEMAFCQHLIYWLQPYQPASSPLSLSSLPLRSLFISGAAKDKVIPVHVVRYFTFLLFVLFGVFCFLLMILFECSSLNMFSSSSSGYWWPFPLFLLNSNLLSFPERMQDNGFLQNAAENLQTWVCP